MRLVSLYFQYNKVRCLPLLKRGCNLEEGGSLNLSPPARLVEMLMNENFFHFVKKNTDLRHFNKYRRGERMVCKKLYSLDYYCHYFLSYLQVATVSLPPIMGEQTQSRWIRQRLATLPMKGFLGGN